MQVNTDENLFKPAARRNVWLLDWRENVDPKAQVPTARLFDFKARYGYEYNRDDGFCVQGNVAVARRVLSQAIGRGTADHRDGASLPGL